METLNYRNNVISIITRIKDGYKVYLIKVNGITLIPVSNPQTARRIAIGLIDNVLDSPKKYKHLEIIK